jgi:hypothetical protein
MALKDYVIVLALGVLIGAVVGGAVMAADVAPIETIDDVMGSDDELAGIGDGPDVGSDGTDGDSEETPTDTSDGASPTPTDTATATAADGGAETATATDTATPTETAAGTSAGTATDTATATAAGDPFSFFITEITNCGDTCRDISAELTNEQSSEAGNVTTYTRIYAGNTTAEDAKVWENRKQFGAMAPGETQQTTQRVEFSLTDAVTINEKDGWVTIVTTINSEDETMTVTERRKVT